MYLPAHFEQRDRGELHGLIAAHPLGVLVVHGPDGLVANHLPFELLPDAGAQGTLVAHLARANDAWRQVRDGDEVLVVFRAEEAYVSPNWYPSKHAFHRQVPTWNYRVVHVHGRVRVRDDERFVRGVVARLTRRHEAGTGDAKPWKMGDSEANFIDEMLGKIVGLEVPIDRIAGKWKLSQNKDERDRASASDALDAHGEPAMARAMRDALDRGRGA